MIWITGAGMLALAFFNHAIVPGGGSMWRLIVAIAIFLYLWWLASLLFDLVFVWHRYIRGDAAMAFLRTHVAEIGAPRPEPPGDDDVTGTLAARIPPSTPRDGKRAPACCPMCGNPATGEQVGLSST